ncbi:MAG: recombinase family protein, partial [Thermacetogeniaceae bacterium]
MATSEGVDYMVRIGATESAARTGVGYCRFSSDMQREESIEAQQDAISRYASRENIVITNWYIDRARSGKTDDRPEFLRMVSDLKRNVVKPDIVLHHKVDRLFRNKADAAVYRRDIRRMGVKVFAVAQPLDPDARPEDIIMESVLDGMAEYYSVNLRYEVLKGLNVNAHKCKFNGGQVLFGFRVNDEGYYEIEESEAAPVRRMFEMVLERRTYGEIEQMMMPYRTRQGNMFSQTTIHEMLQNLKYRGTYIYGRAPRRIEGKRNWRQGREGNPDAITVEDGLPAIVSREVFDQVQELMKGRRKGPQYRGTNYLLTGKVCCGDCKSPMVGTSQRRDANSAKYYYYQCVG